MTGRGRWAAVEQPGRQLVAVRDVAGDRWLRLTGATPAEDLWFAEDDPGLQVTWTTLLVEYGPLDEADLS